MWDLFRQPIKKETVESWAKMLDDFAKVFILAIPVTLIGSESLSFKVFGFMSLSIVAYCYLISSRQLLDRIDVLSQSQENNQ